MNFTTAPFETGKWYFKKRQSRIHSYTCKKDHLYYPQVMQAMCDTEGNIHSVIVPSNNCKLSLVQRKIPKEFYVLYEEFTPTHTEESLFFKQGKRYKVSNRGIIDCLAEIDLGKYGHNTSLRRFLSYGSNRQEQQNVIYINKVDMHGNAIHILGNSCTSEVQSSFRTKIPGWMLMFLEEVGENKPVVAKDPVETMIQNHETLEETTRRELIQDEVVDLPKAEGIMVSHEDLALLDAVKFLIEQSSVDYGSRARIQLSADGYTYGVDSPEFLIKWAEKRRTELMKYSDELFNKINELKATIEKLPK